MRHVPSGAIMSAGLLQPPNALFLWHICSWIWVSYHNHKWVATHCTMGNMWVETSSLMMLPLREVLCKLKLVNVIRNAYSHGQIWASEPCLEEILPDCFLSSETATFHGALAPKECEIFISSMQGLLAWFSQNTIVSQHCKVYCMSLNAQLGSLRHRLPIAVMSPSPWARLVAKSGLMQGHFRAGSGFHGAWNWQMNCKLPVVLQKSTFSTSGDSRLTFYFIRDQLWLDILPAVRSMLQGWSFFKEAV